MAERGPLLDPLKASMVGQPAPYQNDLDGLARHCTEQEDNAAKVERQVLKSAAVDTNVERG
jgi:exoribonuclease R